MPSQVRLQALVTLHASTTILYDNADVDNFQRSRANTTSMSSFFDGIELPVAADFHVHLRDDRMMEAVTPTIRQGGVDTVFVMVVHHSELNARLQPH